MNPRTGFAMMIVGGLIALGGLVWLFTGNVEEDAAPVAATTTETPARNDDHAPPSETVEEFLALCRQALDADDISFLFDRLHPIVTDAFGDELCRGFVEREIAILENYAATGPAGDPVTRSVQGVEIDITDVPVAFDFQGERFEAVSTYALVDGEIRYFAECR